MQASEEVIHKFHGKLDATNENNQTPAHICASKKMNKRGFENLQCLRFLHDKAINSFDVHDSEGRTPEQVADAEQNEARLLFAQVKAEENFKQADENKEMYKNEAEKNTALLKKAKKCKDGLATIVGFFGLLVGKILTHLKESWLTFHLISKMLRRG